MLRYVVTGVFVLLLLVVYGCKPGAIELAKLQQGYQLQGFTLQNLYLDGADKVMGARFLSDRHGMVVDLMQIQSVPQGFMWVKTPPSSDRGEPHACEHLLLGKGAIGRYVANLEGMTLGSSTAWTSQLNTVYHFNTQAGEEAFYTTLEARLDALMNPEFTDEEIRREVCHVGVTEDPATGALFLEEKGTVYSEMISSFEGQSHPLWDTVGDMLYGKDHPLANSSGGNPDSMRTMVPEHMWEFHRQYYRPANMGLIASLPKEMSVTDFLARVDGILGRIWPQGDSSDQIGIQVHDLPPPAPQGRAGEVVLKPYSAESSEQPGAITFSWPAQLELDTQQSIMVDFFLSTFAGQPGTNLYEAFINSETRKMDLGATGAYGFVSDDLGFPVQFYFNGVPAANIEHEQIIAVRELLAQEIQTVYEMADGSEELKTFNERASSSLTSIRKQYREALNKPPMFGFRRGSAGLWQRLLGRLERVDGFSKSLLFVSYLDVFEQKLTTEKNFWREIIDLVRVRESVPFAVAVYPSPEELENAAIAKQARLDGYVAEYKHKYGVDDDQQAMAAYQKDFAVKTAEIEAAAAEDVMPKFIDSPPMTLDGQLDYEVLTLDAGPQMVASTFDNMTSLTMGLALRLDVVPADHLHVLPLLPAVLTRIGVTKDGETIDYVEMQQRLQREITNYNAFISANEQSGRVELTIRCTAAGPEERDALFGWMTASLNSPLLNEDNLPRLHDILDQTLTGQRTRMQGSPESWVNDPPAAWRMQHHPLYLATSSFLTQSHYIHRLGWLLREPGSPAAETALSGLLDELVSAGAGCDRAGLQALLDDPPVIAEEAGCAELAERVIESLRPCLPEIPDATLADDWTYLCRQIKADLLAPPALTLEKLAHCLELLKHTDNARYYLISNSDDRAQVLPKIETFTAEFASTPSQRQTYSTDQRIFARLAGRANLTRKPCFMGLVHEGTSNGVLVFRARTAEPWDTSEDAILNSLAGKTYSGGGSHGLFMRTWGAGLAYSNGYGYRDNTGMLSYYAERCPDVAQTMRFVVDVLKEAEVTDNLVEYAIAEAFNARAAGRYENRGTAMANDLVDGQTPERVRAYREKILEMRQRPDLAAELQSRMPHAYGQVLIGFGPALQDSREGAFFLVGPEEQFVSLEEYIASAEQPQTVYRLYPRDFWAID